jgi:hypothetical protein
LAFQDPIDAFDLLLLTQLQAVFGVLPALLAVLSRGVTAALKGALLGLATGPFQIKLHAFPAADPANGLGVHSILL